MATYIAGPTGAGLQDGSDWDNRLAGLNAVEDLPIAAGDVGIFGPGVYRKQLTVDITGGAGTEITYIGDVSGALTDGIGGIVRITGSDNDKTITRTRCINVAGANKHYRIFRGFSFDSTSAQLILPASGTTNWTFEDCVFQNGANTSAISLLGASSDWIFRRCRFLFGLQEYIVFTPSVPTNDGNHLIENCLFSGDAGAGGGAIQSNDMGGITIRNCTFTGVFAAIRVFALTGGAPVAVTVNNCVFAGNEAACWATNLGDIVENFNAFDGNRFDRINVAVGGNSQGWPPLFRTPILFSGVSQISGIRYPPLVSGELSEWSQFSRITGVNVPTEDYLGLSRPPVAGDSSWGAIQNQRIERGTTVVAAGAASLCILDVGAHQIWRLVTGAQITVSVKAYHDAGYIGVLPQMIIKQPGQADRTTTDTGGAGTFNTLTDTFVPSATPPYIIIELKSNNTGGTSVYFDSLEIT